MPAARPPYSHLMMRRLLFSLCIVLLAGTPAIADQYDPRLDDLFARLAAAGDRQEAVRIGVAIRDIWRIYDGDSYDVIEFLNRGSRAAARGEDHLAELSYGGVIRRAPNYVEGWHQRGRQRFRVGDLSGAVADLKFAVGLEPRHFDALSTLGECYVALNEPEQALAAFEAALAIHPHLATAAEPAAELRRALGEPI